MNSSLRMYATSWCPDCRRARQFLRERHLSFEEIDIDAHPEAAEFVQRVNSGKRKVPTFELDGRVFHCSPYDAQKLARELGGRNVTSPVLSAASTERRATEGEGAKCPVKPSP